jgi:methylisocitrate lyase
MTPHEKRVKYKEMINSGELIVCVTAYDCLSARLIEQAGFEATGIASYGTSVSRFGFPDVGLLTMTELAEHARRVAEAVDIPVGADAENGFYRAEHIWRTVREFEAAGVSSIMIEDALQGKHTKEAKRVEEAKTMANKIKAACDARQDQAFLINARTDSYYTYRNASETVDRANLYLEAGADFVTLAFGEKDWTPEEIGEIRHLIKGPVACTAITSVSLERWRAAGINLVTYWQVAVWAAYKALRNVLKEFKETQDYSRMGEWVFNEREFNKALPYFRTMYENIKKYGEK